MDREVLFVVSAWSVTERGAQVLEGCWQEFVDSGGWVWGAPGQVGPGGPIRAEYKIARWLPSNAPVAIHFEGGRLLGMLSGAHFSHMMAPALTRVANECVASGWMWQPVSWAGAA